MLASALSLLMLACAVSLDGFGAGITYGLRQIRIPFLSVAIIASCSGLVILLSMLVGAGLSGWLQDRAASAVGAVILIAVGLWAVLQFVRGGSADRAGGPDRQGGGRPAGDAAGSGGEPFLKLELRLFGVIVQILRSPSAADMDRSGVITAGEAFLLGAALSLDASGAGIGAALIGLPPVGTALLIAAASGLFLWLGMRAGLLLAGRRWVRRLSVLPGLILIAMGLIKLL